MSRLLSLILLLSLCVSSGADCCAPDLSAMAAATAGGGCHDMPSDDGDQHRDEPSKAGFSDCNSCVYCVSSAPAATSVSAAVLLIPFDRAAPPVAPAGLPPFAPPLRPPIAEAPALTIV
ncbi:DUF2946 family protein [Pseudoxanthomonas sp. CAU 1598]|uniref:DUF2946 family protein n=1 Tax=Pseudomarimonas arenosa TaxID=2774145 RepID=A0AAW3ZI27_9GAMM|nr:DUF2946 family protein [Pseudomarimonas arenosa]